MPSAHPFTRDRPGALAAAAAPSVRGQGVTPTSHAQVVSIMNGTEIAARAIAGRRGRAMASQTKPGTTASTIRGRLATALYPIMVNVATAAYTTIAVVSL